MEISSAKNIGEMKVILRSNRAYFVGGVFPKIRRPNWTNSPSHLRFLPFKVPSWSNHTFGNLKIDLPAPPLYEEESGSLDENTKLYYSADPMSGDCYSIMMEQYSKYASF